MLKNRKQESTYYEWWVHPDEMYTLTGPGYSHA